LTGWTISGKKGEPFPPFGAGFSFAGMAENVEKYGVFEVLGVDLGTLLVYN
jgi:hypothetical protein